MKELQEKLHQEIESQTKLRKTNAEMKASLKRQEDLVSEYGEKLNSTSNSRDSLEREKIFVQTQLEALRIETKKQSDFVSIAENKAKLLQEQVLFLFQFF